MIWFYITCVLFLLMLSVIDIFTFDKKEGYIPSFLTDIFMVLGFAIGFLSYGNFVVVAGVFGALLGLVFSDMNVWGGWADFKLFVGASFFFSTLGSVCVFGLLVVVLGLGFKAFIKYKNKHDYWKVKEVPFIPVIFISFVIAGVMNLLGVI